MTSINTEQSLTPKERRSIAFKSRYRTLPAPNRSYPYSDCVPFTGPITRDLIYHIWPTRNKGIWQRNVDHLLSRISLFNGRRIIGVVTDESSESADAVIERFAGHQCEFIVRPNHKRFGEVVTFPEMLSQVESTDRNRVVFYGHAKGVKHDPVGPPNLTVHRWADAMYETCLDHWEHVQSLLESNVFAGSFRRSFSVQSRAWHYSGTFFWFRSCKVFTRRWKKILKQYGGVEFWPGRVARLHESACLFLDGCGNLYDPIYWKNVVDPQLIGLRQERAADSNKSP